jgi:ASC-1-like (ASCH) protein
MSKFKASTHDKIEQRVKELLRPKIEPGKTYLFNGRDANGPAVLERPVIEVDDQHVTYLRQGVPTKCQLVTFQRMYEEHGVETDLT